MATGKPVKVAFLADTSELRSSLAKAEAAMSDAATEAVAAGDKMDAAFSGVAGAADGVASASSQAAGGIGDLGGALSLMPGPLGALGAGMEAAAPAIMGVTGAADLLNLATEKFPALAKAQAVATKAVAAAQKALNFVMANSPIFIIVAIIIAIVGALVLLYKRNEAFRELVDRVWAKIKDVVGGVAAFFMDVVFPKIRDFITKAAEKFDDIRTKVAAVIGAYRSGGGGALGKLWALVDAIGGMKEQIGAKASGMWDGLKDSFKSVINTMIGWWNNFSLSLDIPDKIPGLPGSFTISTPNIPMLADGGIVTSPTLAVIGEAGPEAVIPLNGRYGLGGSFRVAVELTAEQLHQLERGRRATLDIAAYQAAGGLPV